MKWRRPLRVALAATGIAFAIALFAMRRDREAPRESPPSAMSTDPAAVSESAGGRVEHFHGGRLEFTIDHAGQRAYPDGRTQFLSAHVRFEETGREIWADRLETRGQFVNTSQPGALQLSGNVRLVEGEALSVETDEATYDDTTGALDIPGHVRFSRNQLSGSGLGATYDREADLFRILAEAQATVAASEDGAEPLSLSSSRMSLASAQNYLQMDEAARIVRETETLAGDSATMTFVGEGSQVRFLELRGHASVTPHTGTANVPAMKADDITLSFRTEERTLEHATLTGGASIRFQEKAGTRAIEASWLDLFLAPDGQTVTRLDGRDRVVVTLPAGPETPAREIRAATLTAAGTPATGLQSARFSENVSFTEDRPARRGVPAERRTARSQALTLLLDGGFEAISSAVFRGSVTFETTDTRGEADRARYHATEGRLVLERGDSGPTRQARVRRVDGSLTVDAENIDLSVDTQDLVATGNVTSVSRPETGREGTATGLFEAGKPVYGSAAELRYEAQRGTATYRGEPERPARLVQGENRVVAAEVKIERETNNLTASGSVESLFIETPEDPAAEPRSSEVTADALVYEDASRTATYTGTVRFGNQDGRTEADRLVLQLSASRTVAAFDATGETVFAELTGGHEAKGQRLTYTGETRAYTLIGRPAQAKSPDESGGGCVLTIGAQATLTPGRGASWQSTAPGPVQTRKVKCEVSIR